MAPTWKQLGERAEAARIWAGIKSRVRLGELLMEREEGWPGSRQTLNRLAKGANLAADGPTPEEWAQAIADVTGAPAWFLLDGFEGAMTALDGPPPEQLEAAAARAAQVAADYARLLDEVRALAGGSDANQLERELATRAAQDAPRDRADDAGSQAPPGQAQGS
jgi:hypothetical protein